MFIGADSTATLTDLTVEDNEATYGPDVSNTGTFTCGTSCGIGQYGNCSETALTSDALYKCYVNCGLCRSCPAGTSNNNAGSTSDSSCQACPVGHVSSRAGAESCTSCEAGHYATDESRDYIVLEKATNCSTVSPGILALPFTFCLCTTQHCQYQSPSYACTTSVSSWLSSGSHELGLLRAMRRWKELQRSDRGNHVHDVPGRDLLID